MARVVRPLAAVILVHLVLAVCGLANQLANQAAPPPVSGAAAVRGAVLRSRQQHQWRQQLQAPARQGDQGNLDLLLGVQELL